MKNKKVIIIAVVIVLFIAMVGVGTWFFVGGKTGTQEIGENVKNIEVEYSEVELDSSWDDGMAVEIVFSDDGVTSSNTSKASVKDGVVTVKAAGEYHFSGESRNGQIIVDSSSEDEVQLILDNLDLTCKSSASIFVKQADEVVITLEDGSTNTLTDGDSYELDEEEEPAAAIFSKDDLVINGTGTLNVVANYKDGIASKDDLKIVSGVINIKANDDGIRGKDYVAIKDGTITITASGDGIKSTNGDSEDVGYVVIEGGNITINSTLDGIQAENEVQIKDGIVSITTGGGSTNSSSSNKNWGEWNRTSTSTDTKSAKGIKAGNNISITGGTINLNTSDDAIHSNSTVGIADGNIKITSGDDGIHADDSIAIDNGKIDIEKSYEGIEASKVTINNGEIYVTASDDGVNVAGGNDGSSMNGRPGQNNMNSANSSYSILTINGGYIYVNATGDGLDSNGSAYMNGGVVIVNGPTNNGNGALDYDGTFEVNGGLLIAAGSSGMLQTASNNSKINCISVTFDSAQEAGKIISILDSSDNEVVTFAPSKTYQSVVICTSEFKTGETYKVYSGGTSSKSETNGLYENGGYTKGNQVTELTVNNTVTTYGSSGMGNGQGGMQRGGNMQGGNSQGGMQQGGNI